MILSGQEMQAAGEQAQQERPWQRQAYQPSDAIPEADAILEADGIQDPRAGQRMCSAAGSEAGAPGDTDGQEAAGEAERGAGSALEEC